MKLEEITSGPHARHTVKVGNRTVVMLERLQWIPVRALKRHNNKRGAANR